METGNGKKFLPPRLRNWVCQCPKEELGLIRDSHNYPFYLRAHCDLMSLRTLEVWNQDHSDLTCEEKEWITVEDERTPLLIRHLS